MRALVRQAAADLRTYRLQSALILLMLFGATVTLTLAVTVRRGMAEPYERALERANGAHIWFYAQRPDVDWGRIAALDGVAGTSGPYTFITAETPRAGPDGRTGREGLMLRALPAEPPAIGRPIVTEGRWLREGAADEIVLDRNYARARGLRPGDRIEFFTPAGRRALTVAGLTLDPSRGPYPEWEPALAYTLPATLVAIEPRPERLRFIYGVRLADREASERVTGAAYALFPEETLGGTDNWREVRESITEVNDIYTVLLGVFSVFALGASGFVIANAIGGRVVAQFREIGLLKAIGFTPGQVIGLFLVEHLVLGLAASLAGIAVAAALAPGFLADTAELYNTTAPSAFAPGVALLVLGGVALCVTLCTLLPAWQAGNIPPVRAIAVGFARAQGRASLAARLAARLRLPASVVLGVKDAFARPVRAWLTVAALSLTVATAVFALAMEGTLRDFQHDPSMFGDSFPLEVARGARPDAEMRAFLAGTPGVAGVFARHDFRVRVPGGGDSMLLRAVDEPYDQLGFGIRGGRMFEAPGEAVAGQNLLDLLGLRIGDELRVTVEGRPLALRIVGRYIETGEDGRTAMLSLGTLQEQINPRIQPNRYGLALAPGVDREAVRTAIQTAPPPSPGEPVLVFVFEDDLADDITLVRGILVGLNGVLLLIGLANLLTTAMLGVRERLRDLAIFKAIGLTPAQMMATVLSGAGLLAAVAALAGIPLGLVVTRLLFDQLGRQTGIGTGLGATPPVVALALLIPAAVLFAALASAIPARRAARVQVAEALRME